MRLLSSPPNSCRDRLKNPIFLRADLACKHYNNPRGRHHGSAMAKMLIIAEYIEVLIQELVKEHINNQHLVDNITYQTPGQTSHELGVIC